MFNVESAGTINKSSENSQPYMDVKQEMLMGRLKLDFFLLLIHGFKELEVP